MLSLLLDENMSPVIAAQISSKRPEIPIQSLHTWQDGVFMGIEDGRVLQAATASGLTLVTYDLKTIPPLLAEWGALGRIHTGVLLIDERSIAGDDFGGLVRALIAHWDRYHQDDWDNRIDFLRPAE